MYKESIVSYFEILGFDDLIQSKNFGDALHVIELVKFLCDYTNLSTAFSNLPDEHVNHSSISGFIVRSIDIECESILNEIAALGIMQARLIIHGFLIKGGISVGKHYVSEYVALGPALSDAKNLDLNLAYFPRILISNSVAVNSECIKKDHDGLAYIDYLRVYSEIDRDSYPEDESEDLFTLLQSHKKLISKIPKNSKNKYVTCSQYLWLKNYHNSFVKNCTLLTDEEKNKLHH